MTILRRLLGIFVMLAGTIGLLLSLAGLVGLWRVKPALTTSIGTTLSTLSTSVDTSQQAMVITGEALGATIDSVDALSEMLITTSVTISDTQPVIVQVNSVMGDSLPQALEAAVESLDTAQEAASSLEGAIQSLDAFRSIVAAIPLIGSMIPQDFQPYRPEKPLADSLGELSTSIREMPATFQEISVQMDTADDNLVLVQTNLETMSTSVASISTSLSRYQAIIDDSQASMDSLKSILTNLENNLEQILNITSIVLGLFFFWFLAAQVVIFSQGWELYHGTAGRMEAPLPEPAAAAETAGEN